jgi:hypothetical protein
MRSATTFGRTFVRGIRRRAPQKPAGFIEDATTFADTHTVLNDPFTPMPYPDKQLFGYLKQAQKVETAHAARKEVAKVPILKDGLVFDHIPIERQIFLFFPGQVSYIGLFKNHLNFRASSM